MRLDKTTLRLDVRNSSLRYHHVIWNEKTSIQAKKISCDWLFWVYARVLIGSFELLHVLTTGQDNRIVHDLTTTLNYNPSAIRLLCLKETLPWTWEDAVALDKRCVFLSFYGSPLPATNTDAFTKKPNLLVFSPCILSWFNIIETKTPSEKESFKTKV